MTAECDSAFLLPCTPTVTHRVCQLGISPRYIQTIARNGFEPRKNHDLSALKQIYTTGAPVTPDVYDYVAQKVRGTSWRPVRRPRVNVNGAIDS